MILLVGSALFSWEAVLGLAPARWPTCMLVNRKSVRQTVDAGPRIVGTPSSPDHTGEELQPHANLSWVISAHALLRISSGTSGILVGIYLASLKNHGAHLSAGLVGTLSAVSFAAELFASIPMGVASDAVQPRWLMTGGAVIGALAAFLFAMSGSTSIFFFSRL